MQIHAYVRFRYTAQMYLPLEDPNSDQPVLTYIKDVNVEFTNDPNTPRQVIVCEEPLPRRTELTGLMDRYGVQPVPGGIWTITSIEPVINTFGFRELFRMQAAMANNPNFGYEGIVIE